MNNLVIAVWIALVAAAFGGGYIFCYLRIRRSKIVVDAIRDEMKECSIQHHCIVKQQHDTGDWTRDLTKKMLKRLAKRERARAQEDERMDGHK